jgi:hypothetical protein
MLVIESPPAKVIDRDGVPAAERMTWNGEKRPQQPGCPTHIAAGTRLGPLNVVRSAVWPRAQN